MEFKGLTDVQKKNLVAMRRTIDTLCTIDRIKTEQDLKTIKQCLDYLIYFLPGPITPQKLTQIEDKTFNQILIDRLSQLQGTIVTILLPHWPVLKDEVNYVFKIEESFEVSRETLTNICGYLKEDDRDTVLEALAYIIMEYIKSDAIFTAIVDCCSRVTQLEDYTLQDEWESYVQLLVTVPERVANKLKTNTPKEYSHENYSYLLIFHIIRAMDFMCDSSYHQDFKYHVSYLSLLVSRFINNFSSAANYEVMFKFVDILIAWSAAKNNIYCKFVKRKLIQTLMSRLDRQAIDKISITILKRCPIDYKSAEQSIRCLLGNAIDDKKDWFEIYVLKIPYNCHLKDFKITTQMENLIYYISTSKNSVQLLTDLILQLAKSWTEGPKINIGNISNHMYTSALLVLAVKYRLVLWSKRKVDWSLVDLKKILFKGMANHLDCLAQEFRCIGMATIEILFKMLVEVDESDKKAVMSLNFDFTDLGGVCVDIFKTLKNISKKCLIDPKRSVFHVKKKVEVEVILNDIAERIYGNVEKPVQNTIITCAVKSTAQTKEIVKTIISVKLDALEKSGRNEDLDSDDDLQPYDMSNDISTAAKKKPNYLRDLIEIITEAKEVESFEAALEVAEELVVQQLKTDDKKLAIELLDIFVHLDEKFHVDDFEKIKFNTAVEIVCSQPCACAEHLCKEIHADIGRYSIATKIFMLEVFAEAAIRIADVRPSTKKAKAEIVTEIKDTSPEEIIRQRLLCKTRYFHTKRRHPLSKAKKNKFAAVSDFFFYPLIGGFGYRQLSLSHHNVKQDIDNILLLKYLAVVGNIILASKNCPKCPAYCREIVQMVMYLRFSPEPKIQMSVMSIIASIILALPPSILNAEFFDVMVEFRGWLYDCLNHIDITMGFGGTKSEMAVFAGQVLHMIETNLGK